MKDCDFLFFKAIMNKKKNNNDFVDVPMDNFEGAEILYLFVGLYILRKLTVSSNGGLYRDRSLGVINLAKPVAYKKKQENKCLK